ncbi:hypothetical protein C8J55DRAFT_556587 [Lentinula edodes]|uniref:Uncharacterized protein n=1 Tax=Lentinula lateritia TaxID=40482 RepID=A0A9W9AWS4_9AGAR|nr:hypothetical protein C8J55DRAFT_556587 [Lentinula edodes]
MDLTAPPLEMLDRITTQLEHGQKEGFWLWDVQKKAMVLTIPAILVMLGDNPMQSRDANDEQPASATKDVADDTSIHSNASTEQESDSGAKKKGGHQKETIQELISRAKQFITLWDLDLGNAEATPYIELRAASPLPPPTLEDVHP